MGEVSAAHMLCADEQLVYRPGDRFRECKPHDERRELDDQEEASDRSQGDQDRIPETDVADPSLRSKHALIERRWRHADLQREIPRLAAVPGTVTSTTGSTPIRRSPPASSNATIDAPRSSAPISRSIRTASPGRSEGRR